MTNRTASVNHASLSDKAHEAGRIEPLPSTLDRIAKIRKDNEAIRDAEKHIGRKMTIAEMKTFLAECEQLDAYAAELREGREAWNLEQIEGVVGLSQKVRFHGSGKSLRLSKPNQEYHVECEISARIARSIFAAQIVGTL